MDSRLERFTVPERVTHWLVAICYVYAGLSGLALWSRAMWWLAPVMGGGENLRAWHPIAGVIFALLLAMQFRRWAAQMKLDADDRKWLAMSGRYAMHDEHGVPESGRFNAGQKMLFWLQSTSAIVLFATGAVLWFPELMPRGPRLISILVHPVAAVASMGGIIVHIYMTTVVVQGALHAMTRGYVTEGWAKSHHAKWFRQVTRQ